MKFVIIIVPFYSIVINYKIELLSTYQFSEKNFGENFGVLISGS